MLFILQDKNESDAMSIEVEELRYELDHSPEHNYIVAKSNFFNKAQHNINLKNAIPVGTIEFVQAYLSNVHNIHHMSPIEIPKELRLPHLLLRDYQIVKSSDIPNGVFNFVKDVSVLKQPTFIGNTNDIPDGFLKPDIQCKLPGNTTLYEPGHLYQVSDVLNILSEYRVIVINDKIYGIQFYDGNPTIMPTPQEIKKIQEMVVRYSVNKARPGAYAMDIAVVKTENEQGRDVALIEVQSATSIGTYGCRGPFLPDMYRLGIKWYIEHNVEIKTTD